MKVVTTVQIDDEDYRLLDLVVPEDPCKQCVFRGCTNCKKQEKYEAAIKPIKDAGLLEAKQHVDRICLDLQDLRELKHSIQRECAAVKDIGFDLDKIFGAVILKELVDLSDGIDSERMASKVNAFS